MSAPGESPANFGDTVLGEEATTQLVESVAGARNTALLTVIRSDPFSRFSSSDIDDIYKEAFATQGEPHTASGELITPPRASAQLRHTSSALITPMEEGSRWSPSIYSPSSFAIERCRPLAGHVARIATKFDIAPADLVGHRSRPKSGDLEQTMVRLALYGTMLTAARKQRSEETTWNLSGLADAAGVNVRTLHNQVDALCRAKIVHATRGQKRSSYPTYLHAEKPNLAITTLDTALKETGWNMKKRNLTQWLFEQITAGTLPHLSVSDILKEIDSQERTAQFFATKKTSAQRIALNDALELLVQVGFLTIDETTVNQQIESLTLGETGKEIIEEYITATGNIMLNNGKIIATGMRIADEVAANKTALGWLLTVDQKKGAVEAYKSLSAKKHVLAQVLSGRKLSTSQVCEAVGWNQGATSRTLAQLEEQGVVRSDSSGRDTQWELS